MSQAPSVSVLIPAYNREGLIGSAIASILAQTMSNLELVIVDDGSTDDTVSVVEHFDDPRIKLVRHSQNRGIPAARNSALEAATGEFIAWLDSDDVARPIRLERQLAYLKASPDVVLVGSCAGKLHEDGAHKSGTRVPPLAHDDIRCWLLFRSAFQQSSLFGRRAVLRRYPYRPEFPVCEDVDMFVRLTAKHRVANLPEVLVDRRIHSAQTVRHNHEPIIAAQSAISGPLLAAMGVDHTSEDLRRHVLLGGSLGLSGERDYLAWAHNWLGRLITINDCTQIYNRKALRLCASFLWIRACARTSNPLIGASRIASSSLTPGILSSHGRAWLKQALRLIRQG